MIWSSLTFVESGPCRHTVKTADQYLQQVISRYRSDEFGARNQVQAVYPLVQNWANQYLVDGFYSGSIARGTTVSPGTDADVFLSLSAATPENMPQIYLSLYDAFAQNGIQVCKRDIAIGVFSGGYRIDFIPGKLTDPNGFDHCLYKNRTESLFTTNINKHLQLAIDSKRSDEIKLIKIWRELNSLSFPSFYLELVVQDCLAGRPRNDLSASFWRVLGFLSAGFPRKRYVDPANPENIVSNDLTYPEKKLIQRVARIARSQRHWGQIVK